MTHKAATKMDGDAQDHLQRPADARQRKAIRQDAFTWGEYRATRIGQFTERIAAMPGAWHFQGTLANRQIKKSSSARTAGDKCLREGYRAKIAISGTFHSGKTARKLPSCRCGLAR